MSKLSKYYFYISLLLLSILMSLTLHSDKSGADGRNYLRWTHSISFDQDLHLLNNAAAVGGDVNVTPTGYIFERVNIGTAVMWTPFLWLSQIFLPVEVDPVQNFLPEVQFFWLNFSSWLYTVLAGLIIISVLWQSYCTSVIVQAGLGILIGTPVLFYMVTFPHSSHPCILFVSAIYFHVWWSMPTKPTLSQYLLQGVLIGWLMQIATYNVVFLILPGLALLEQLITVRAFKLTFQHGIALALGGFLGFGPQMLVWWLLFGSPFATPYGNQLNWTEPYLWETLISSFHGLLFYAPVIVLAVIGWLTELRTQPRRPISLLLCGIALTYIVSVNVAWWAGSSFGNRYFLTLTPFFVSGLAQFLQVYKRYGKVLFLITVIWSIGLYLQFLNGVSFTSDSVVYPATTLVQNQLFIWLDLLNILPKLFAAQLWTTTSSSLLPMFVILFFCVNTIIYHILKRTDWNNQRLAQTVGCFGLLLFIGFIWLGYRSEQTKFALAKTDFYKQDHRLIRYEIKEVAGRAGLVTRAMYHQQTNQPDKAIADLRLASQLWKYEEMPVPQRHYLGPKTVAELRPFEPCLMEFSDQAVRLLGYRLDTTSPTIITGELIWEKLASLNKKERLIVQPIVRAFNQHGRLEAYTLLDFPFPAYYVPVGSIFQDHFELQLSPPLSKLWLDVSLLEANALPVDETQTPVSGFFARVTPDIDCSSSQMLLPDKLRVPYFRRYLWQTPQQVLQHKFLDEIELQGYDLSIILHQTDAQAHLTLYWIATAHGRRDYTVQINLLDNHKQSKIVVQHTPVNGERPTSTWLQDEQLLDEEMITVPPLPAGSYTLALSLLDSATEQLVSTPIVLQTIELGKK